ncbi:MAG: hypothetical protein ONB13_02315 [candidate division KSB1 bacterium]|nr:hypothetical protein [candidate division KSB1 bacterium]MDZ7335264.1 hypothetical protein [candidate division KSB1 bacterium]MDZ7375431.1 hypothetical protein [candidate division KSB1 bacterium]MDZ7399801.1 hypothetical protein [candidate division KSB1 bacterium]
MDTTAGESEKKLLADAVRERLIGNKNFISYKELIDKRLPTFLKNFLQNSVQKYIVTEEPFQFNNSKRFDFEYEKIIELKHQLMRAFEEATLFSREELVEIINKTISLQFNLLVKPTTSLIRIFFRNKSERLQTEILQILEGLDDQRMIIKRLIEQIKKFDQYHIVEEDFKKLLDETNKQVYQENFIPAFMGDVKAFVNFLGMIYGIENHQIKLTYVRLLLKERNLEKYWVAFESFPSESISINEIQSLLSQYIAREDSHGGEENTDDIDRFMVLPFSEADDSAEISSKADQDNKAFSQTFIIETPIDQNERQNTTERKILKITNNWKDPMDMVIQRSNIEKQPQGPLVSLKIMIGEKDRRLIQKRIFDNDIYAYDEFISNLDLIDNWKDAKKLIDSELQNRSIGLYSKEALRLGDLVFNRYFPNNR